jgi:single stranded DNA-binding protein
MAVGVNRWHGIGNMTRDPELKQGEQERSDRCEFSIGINKPGENNEPLFLDIIVWDKLARQVSQYGRKGRLVFCEGEIEIRKWETQEGEQRRSIRIKAYVVNFLDRRDDDSREREEPKRPTSRASDFDDLPF